MRDHVISQRPKPSRSRARNLKEIRDVDIDDAGFPANAKQPAAV
jgi:hypothetical protein